MTDCSSLYKAHQPSATSPLFFDNLHFESCLEMDDDATIQAACCRLGLAIPGLHLRTRCLQNCTQMNLDSWLTFLSKCSKWRLSKKVD